MKNLIIETVTDEELAQKDVAAYICCERGQEYSLYAPRHLFEKPQSILSWLDESAQERWVSGDLMLDPNHLMVYIKGQPIHITSQEAILLRCLMANSPFVLTRDRLIDLLEAREPSQTYASGNNVSVYISRLRHKIGNDYIVTIRQIGYQWNGKVHKLI